MKFTPHPYQERAIDKILSLPDVGLFLDMGLGKTAITLTAVAELLENFTVDRVLVVAPLAVARDTWSREHLKWDHLHWLKISKILGTAAERKAAADAEADIYVINRENVKWLTDNYTGRRFKWDMLVVDELSSFKSPSSERFKALRRVRPKFRRIVGLTGTPEPNGLLDLWAQIFILDGGERLGKFIGRYRATYFRPGKMNPGTGVVYNYEPLEGSEEKIIQRISDITVSMSAADYLKLPQRIDNEIRIELPARALRKYRELEAERLLEIEDTEISAASAAAVMGKLLQMAGGAVYNDDGGWTEIHDEKIRALRDIIDTTTEPVLVFYGYRHERERLLKAFGSLDPRELKTEDDIRDWNSGKIRMLLAHPASVGYGLNLQDGGRIIAWYSLPWSLELYQQANARLYRQGQTKPVIIHHLIAVGTADEQVVRSLKDKNLGQAALMAALKERRDEHHEKENKEDR